jgi:hypothetical protein
MYTPPRLAALQKSKADAESGLAAAEFAGTLQESEG